jgi:uncharacterized protein
MQSTQMSFETLCSARGHTSSGFHRDHRIWLPERQRPSFWTLRFLIVAAFAATATAQQLQLPDGSSIREETLGIELPALARRALDTSEAVQSDRGTRFRLQMIAGEYEAAARTARELMDEIRSGQTGRPYASVIPDQVIADAYVLQASTGIDQNAAIRSAFADVTSKVDAVTASQVAYWLDAPVARLHAQLLAAIEKYRGTHAIALQDAVALICSYQLYEEIAALAPLKASLIAADDNRRYSIDANVMIQTRDPDVTLSAVLVTPKHSETARLPAVLRFTIYPDEDGIGAARTGAAHGYVSVIVYARGKRTSHATIAPWTKESTDTYDAIDWISKQSWSDGQVGMYGGSYDGFSQWAATKHLHPALKTIVPWSPVHPGLVLPMSNNVFQNANYQWPFFVTNNRGLDFAANNDQERWNSLFQRWFASGIPYRHIDQLDREPNPLLQQQLDHPAFDSFWQNIAPYGKDFRRIKIPVLQVTGYFDPSETAALYFLENHYRHDPGAMHYLVIGPYDHSGAQSSIKPDLVGGYHIDRSAQFDTSDLTFDWFEYVMRHGPKPSMLRNRINYEVMGSDKWGHSDSIRAMSNQHLRLFLTSDPVGDHFLLSSTMPSAKASVREVVDFSDRSKTNNLYPVNVLYNSNPAENCLSFVSDPFPEELLVQGRITATLNAVFNKKDADVTVAFYELTSDGTYFNLGYYLGRASFARNMTRRRLLTPGRPEQISIARTPLVAKKLSAGSRLVVLLTINKNPYAQINYGTGKDVSAESIADANTPLKVDWLNSSFVDVPILR